MRISESRSGRGMNKALTDGKEHEGDCQEEEQRNQANVTAQRSDPNGLVRHTTRTKATDGTHSMMNVNANHVMR